MSLTRIASATALVGLLSLGSACGGSAADPDEGALGSTVDPDPTTAAPVTPTPTATRTKETRTASPTATPTEDGGDGDDVGDDEPFTAGGGVCGKLTASDVGDIVGVTVAGSGIPTGGCDFRQAGKTGMTVTIIDKTASAAGGMAGAKTDANSAVEGEPQDVSGIGSAAFVVTGPVFGGPDVNAGGAVQVGNRIISVYLVQRSGLAESKVRTFEVDLLKLVAKRATS